ncbi:MAG TPA: type II toxin-antitoxin system PemK/MazF family toxin [Acidobacteria bacterium]|nr:type II toxin-antitoxin system PemK/MazF family toxin [Acidobacteriota bacterium]
MKSGEIWWVRLDPAVGDELRKIRPVLVLNPGHERFLRLAVVVPVTGWRPRWADNPFFVRLEPSGANGLAKVSAVDCFQIRALSHERFQRRAGSVTSSEHDRVLRALALILDMDPEHCQLLQ